MGHNKTSRVGGPGHAHRFRKAEVQKRSFRGRLGADFLFSSASVRKVNARAADIYDFYANVTNNLAMKNEKCERAHYFNMHFMPFTNRID